VLWNPDPGGGFSLAGIGAGDTTLDIGDRVVSVARVDQLLNSNGLFLSTWTDEYTAVAVAEVVDKVAIPVIGGFAYSFGPASTVDPLGLGWDASGDTMIATYSDAGNDGNVTAVTSVADGIARFSSGTPYWEFGMTLPADTFASGPPVANAAFETWNAIAPSDDVSILNAGGGAGLVVGSFTVALNLIDSNSAPVVLTEVVPGTGLELTGGGSIKSTGLTASGFDLGNDFNISLNVIPEPATSLLMLGLASAAAVFGRHRREAR
jgi:hypothetical protein